MKKLALPALFSLLAACLTQSNDSSTTPNPSEATEDQPAEISCLAPIDPVSSPAVQQWTGVLPENPPARSVYVIQPLDDSNQQFLLTLTYPTKKEILAAYLLPSLQEKLDAMNKISQQTFNYPQILLAVLGGLRPLPQPGPPGQPGIAYKKALNAANAMVWAELQAYKPLFGQVDGSPTHGSAPSPTHGN